MVDGLRTALHSNHRTPGKCKIGFPGGWTLTYFWSILFLRYALALQLTHSFPKAPGNDAEGTKFTKPKACSH